MSRMGRLVLPNHSRDDKQEDALVACSVLSLKMYSDKFNTCESVLVDSEYVFSLSEERRLH